MKSRRTLLLENLALRHQLLVLRRRWLQRRADSGSCPAVSNRWLATLMIGLAAAGHQGWAANLFALAADLFPKPAAASVVGFGGMFGSIASMLFAQSAGLILQRTGNYWSLFFIAGCAYLLALAVMHALILYASPAELRSA